MAQTAEGALDELHDATQARERAQGELDNPDHEFRRAVRRAIEMGVPVRLIADTANVSRSATTAPVAHAGNDEAPPADESAGGAGWAILGSNQ
jgi:hypothetical protein